MRTSSAASKFAERALARMNSACRCDFSRHSAETAPRLRQSRLNAPVPANNSSTRAPTTRAPKLLKTACLTRSGVGRTSNPLGTLRIRRAALPPVMRMSLFGRVAVPTTQIQGRRPAVPPEKLFKNLVKKQFHVFPRALVRLFVVGHPFGIVITRHRLGEGMDRPAEFDELPVHPAPAHFIFQCGNVLRR